MNSFKIISFLLIALSSASYSMSFDDAYDDFYEAIKNNKISAVEALIRKGAHKNPTDKFSGDTPLHDAAEFNRLEIAQLLIQVGIPVDSKNRRTQTPLHIAVAKNHPEMVRLLANKSTQINSYMIITNKYTFQTEQAAPTLLHFSLEKDYTDIAKILIEAGADIHLVARLLEKPLLHLAVEKNNYTIAELLIKKGVNVDKRDLRNNTAWDIAKQKGPSHQKIELLLRNSSGPAATPVTTPVTIPAAPASQKNNSSLNLFGAAFANLTYVAQTILAEDKEQANSVDNDGNNPLHFAVDHNSYGVAMLLLENGAKVDNKNNKNQTPLHRAVQLAVTTNELEMVELLIANKADVHSNMEVNIKGVLRFVTPLYYALMHKNEPLVIILLKAGAMLKANTELDPTVQNFLARCLASAGVAFLAKTNKSLDPSDPRVPTKSQNSPMPATSQPKAPASPKQPDTRDHVPSSNIESSAKITSHSVWFKRTVIATMGAAALGYTIYRLYPDIKGEKVTDFSLLNKFENTTALSSPLNNQTINSLNEDDE